MTAGPDATAATAAPAGSAQASAASSLAPAPPPPPRPRRWPRRLVLAAGVLLLLAALITWALPPALSALLRHELPLRLGAALGRPVSVGAVQVRPWQLALSIEQLRIGHAPGSGAGGADAALPQLELGRLAITVAPSSLRHRAPVLQSLQLQSLRLRLARTAAGRSDIDDLLQRLATPAPNQPPAAAPARFAIYNLQLDDGEITLDDRPAGRRHRIEALSLGLPFLSNLPADVAVHTEPRLRLRIDGTTIDSGGKALPFAQTRQATLDIGFDGLDLAPWLVYQPPALALRVARGRLSTRLSIDFSQAAQGPPRVQLRGGLRLDDLALQARDGAALAGWTQLALELRDVQPLARRVALGTLRIDDPQLTLSRHADGRLNWQALASPAAAAASNGPHGQAAAAPAAASASEPATPPATAAPGDWQFSLERLQLQRGMLDWRDATLPGTPHWQLAGLALQADGLRWPALSSVPVTLDATLQHQGQALGRLALEAQAGQQAASASLTLSDLQLAAAAPYLAPHLRPRLDGRLNLRAQLDWRRGTPAARLVLAVPELRLEQLALRQPARPGQRASPLAGWQALTVHDAQFDLQARRAHLGRVRLAGPQLGVVRAADGQLNLQQWWRADAAAPAGRAGPARPPPVPATATATATAKVATAKATTAKAATSPASPGARPAPAPPAAGWQWALDELAVDGGRLQFTDLGVSDAPGEPLRLALAPLRLRLRQAQWPPASGRATMPLQIDTRLGVPTASDDPIAAGRRAAPLGGELRWAGRLGLNPLRVEGRLQARKLPLHLAERYAAEAMGPLTLLHAEADLTARLALRQQPAGWQLDTGGELRLDDLHLHSRPEAGGRLDAASELLSWQSLALNGLQLSLAPGARPRLTVAEAALTDFYSRLVITEDGRFNLRDMAAAPDGATAAAPAAPAAASAEPAAANAAPAASAASNAAATPPTPPASAPAAAFPIALEVGATRLVNGRVDFTDRFIRPNYSARLSALNGQLGTLRSDTREMATLTLSGRAADTATLEISGQLNPTAQPLALDIRARASDLELAPLSPYAGKYAGYAIERGKLSMDVHYRIEPDGRLDAKNQVILNQLTFGERVESPDATQLPVRLAIALLKDRHGVIDINLPVSGSLDDPQFSVGGLIFKVIVNLLGKALTAPFSLLSGGGGPDISQVQFEPGVARVTPAGQQVLDKVAQALLDRPALQMTVAGAADPLSEREAWQAATLEARLLAEHRRAQRRAAPATAATAAPAAAAASASASASAAASPIAEAPPIPGDERTRLLRELYRNSALPDRPRNLVGLLRELPAAEMAARLKAGLVVSTEVMRELALQRGLAVRDALVARGLPAERLFLAAPLLRASGEDDAAWVPSVKLTLALP
ncbi:DUF748 domain-containing protein [Aquabacterium sp. OR-4]|uniref:DUF748 domain-containing protein n=1 Tax=Aquabacterium sp. OR-4 TaxID=2978127 RepID=UPI0028C701DA|nr:DUF748 domain-containing protein [Aquabacterium sp. OR-4]MDT7837342.1 DUF748 domain-containing protein [Aquabacterium sp. OR-4]